MEFSAKKLSAKKLSAKQLSTKKFSIRSKLIFFFGVLVILPVMAGNIIMLDANTRVAGEHMRRLNQNNARLAGVKVNEVIDAIFHLSIYIGIEDGIVEYLNAYYGHPQHAAFEARAQRTITSLLTASGYLTAINISSMDGRDISRGGFRAITISDEDKIRADALFGYSFWDIVYTDQGPAIYLCRLLRYINDLSHHLGYIKMVVGLQGLSDLLSPSVDYPHIHYLILDDEGRIVLSSGDQDLDQDLLSGNFYASSFMLSNGWQLLSIISDTNMLLPGLAQTTALTMALVFFICMVLAVLFSAWTVRPLEHMGNLMQQVGRGDFSVKFDIPAEKEIRLLALEFNQMMIELNRLYNVVYAYQLQSYKAQLMEMESKINPHFLYNALDSIYWMAKLQRHEEVCGMSNALSKLFRLALSADSSGFVKLSKELEYLACYQQIQHYRYGDDIVFVTRVDESLNDQTVCRFVLQPIVENAVMHGLSKQKRGTVDIQVFKDENDIVYRVADSGGCVNVPEVQRLLLASDSEIKGTKGLALRNIQNRIRLCYGEPYGLDFYIEGGLTVFEVRQPYDSENDSKNGQEA